MNIDIVEIMTSLHPMYRYYDTVQYTAVNSIATQQQQQDITTINRQK